MTRFLVLLVLTLLPLASHAGFFIEPYLGGDGGNYSQAVSGGTGAYSTITGGTDSGSIKTGGVTGVRGGAAFSIFLAGLDFNIAGINNSSDPVNYDNSNGAFVSFSALAGLQIGNLRVWAKGIDGGIGQSTSQGTFAYQGFGFGAGVGFCIFKHLSIDVEYASISMNKMTAFSNSYTLPATINDGKGDTILLNPYKVNLVFVSIGIPFGLGSREDSKGSRN